MSPRRRETNAPRERTVSVGGARCRVWEKGEGEPVGFLGGLLGLPRWIPFLDRLAEQRRVIAPSLPGFPGGADHRQLDDTLDWVTATLDLIEASDLAGADWVGASVGGTLAAEAAAASGAARRLVLISPFGLFDEEEPVTDVWALRVSELPERLSARPERLAAFLAAPEDADPVEWQIGLTRASEAAARLLWPTGDLGLHKRLHRIRVPTLLLWGSDDRVIPASYAKRIAAGISGWVEMGSVAAAGHTAELDEPDAAAKAVHRFLS